MEISRVFDCVMYLCYPHFPSRLSAGLAVVLFINIKGTWSKSFVFYDSFRKHHDSAINKFFLTVLIRKNFLFD